MTPEQELEHLRFLDELEAHLRQVSDARKALSAALRVTREHFGASEGVIAIKQPGSHTSATMMKWPRETRWDLAWLDGFIGTRKARIPPDTIIAPIDRYGRAWGAIALRRPAAPFEKGTWRWLHRASFLVSEALAGIDRDRMIDVRDRLDRKIMEQLRPKDLFYQILDGLRSLTNYDHSSTLLFREDDDAAFTIVAEQIAWTKGKSRRIGQRLTPDDGVEKILQRREVLGFDRDGENWHERRWQIVDGLAGMLDYNTGPNEEREAAMLVAPIVSKTGVFGLLKVASRHRGSFGRYEAELVERFRSQATIAILNSQRTEFLHTRLVEAEKKHAMADLARGVAHDVNNALGSVVPIVQAMREEVTGGQIEPHVFAEDLKQIETSLLTCRRIFGGMLSFARSGHRTTGVADLGAAVNATLAIMRDGLERRGVTLSVDMPNEIPLLAGGQSDVEQVLLNLVTNARDAMPQGGTLGIRAARQDGLVEVVVSDTGEGIPKELLARVQEPFFTTRSQGSGLGLSIVRSILWEMNGRMVLESEPGHGTSVRFYVPAAPTEVAPMKPARLLVVDDEPGMLRAVERVLGRRHQVASYESPLDALAASKEYDPDLAILDVRMPNMDGFELMGKLQELVPGIDTILMTGSASEPDQKLIRAVRENAFYFIQKPFDSEVLRTLVERCLELRQLADENRRHVRRLEGELSQAQAFQQSLLPKPEAIINGISLAGRYQPTSELGGDFFDFARVGKTGAALVIADVSGHGVSAAMLTGIVKAGFRAAQADEFDPVAVVEQVHSALRGFGFDQFITMVAARITGDTLEYVSAGHPSGLLRTSGGLTALDTTGPIVSQVFPSGSWSTTRHAFGPGTSLVLYTDGISEARSPNEELFGDERIAESVRVNSCSGAALLDALLSEIRQWSAGRPMADDLTLVTASRV